MRAGDELLGLVFNRDHRYVIPIFQRPYVWEEEANWVPLWNDLRRAVENVERETRDGAEPREYFLGALVTQHQAPVPRRTPTSMVIDGQQRMTTLQVFLAAAQRVAHTVGANMAAANLGTLTRNRVAAQSDHPDDRYKVAPLASDASAFEWAMRGAESAARPLDPQHLLVRASRWFEETLTEWVAEAADPADRLDLLYFALENRVKVVSVFLEASDDPQVIFEALNHAGVRLDAADLIKNLLFQTLIQQGDQMLEKELLETCWQALDGKDWRRSVTTGRVKRVRIDTLLAYWLSVQRGEESSAEHLFEEFKRWMRATTPRAADVIRSVRLYADTMDALQARPIEDPVAQVIDRLDAAGQTTPWPLLLFFHAEEGIPAEQATRGAVAIDSYLVRRSVCGLTTKDYNRLFAAVLNALRDGDRDRVGIDLVNLLAAQTAPSRYWPSDQEFALRLNRPDMFAGLVRARLKALLVGIENELLLDRRADAVTLRRAGDKSLTIEHVMPQSWETNWPLDADADEMADVRRRSSIHNLGNLTLVTQSLNSKLSNGPWSVKRPALQSHSLVRLTTASILTCPQGISRYDQVSWVGNWDEDRIELRATWMTFYALRAWPRAADQATSNPTTSQAPGPSPVPLVESGPRSPVPLTSVAANASDRRPVGSVAQHVREVFSAHAAGVELTVREIVACGSTVYSANEVSGGAVHQFLTGPNATDFRVVENITPMRAMMIAPLVTPNPESPTDAADLATLTRDFHREMITVYQRSQKEVGYNPTAFIQMISNHGGVETARRLVGSSAPSDGFATLWEAGRLDLTAEALVRRDRFAALFSAELIDRAQQRLSDHGYQI